MTNKFPHHDGSELYVSNSAPKLGEKVTFKVRVPSTYTFDTALIRFYHDGEPRTATLDRKSTRLNSSHVSESRMPSSA